MRIFLFLLMCLGPTSLSAQEQPFADNGWKETAQPEEIELVELVNQMYSQYEQHHAEADKIEDPTESLRFHLEQDPGHEFVPKLLKFEEQHRGTTVGLMALRKIIHLAAGGGLVKDPAFQGRRSATERFKHYYEHPLLIDMMKSLNIGENDPELLSFLRRLAEDKKAPAALRNFSKYFLAEYLLDSRDKYENKKSRLQELNSGEKPRYLLEKENLKESFALYPAQVEIQKYEQEAIFILNTLTGFQLPHRQPVIKRIDPHGTLVELDVEKTKTARLLTAKAAGLLFKENHLLPGKPAPELAVKLVTDRVWTLKEQRGKVTLIQFSFKGCGPCELMYPYLKQIQETYPEKVSILTIMCDDTIEPSHEYLQSGKINWDVHWDGYRGPLATKWNVTGFPSLYIINQEGQFVSPRVRNELIQPVVEELLVEESE